MHNRTNPPRTREDNNLLKTLINVSTHVKTFSYCCKPVISFIFIDGIMLRFNLMPMEIEVYILFYFQYEKCVSWKVVIIKVVSSYRFSIKNNGIFFKKFTLLKRFHKQIIIYCRNY